jgi:uncharacterized protein YggU (UPF0235/DUF167 family)
MGETLLRLKVTAGARTEGVEPQEDGSFKVRVRVKAEKGRANARVLEVLAEHLGVAKSRLELVRGAASREKLVRLG